jgi:hypothetical protein
MTDKPVEDGNLSKAVTRLSPREVAETHQTGYIYICVCREHHIDSTGKGRNQEKDIYRKRF